jgi:hypothetical protein
MDFDPPVFGPGPVVWVGVVLEGNQVAATIGKNIAVGCAGFGPTIPDALRDLAAVLERKCFATAAPMVAFVQHCSKHGLAGSSTGIISCLD